MFCKAWSGLGKNVLLILTFLAHICKFSRFLCFVFQEQEVVKDFEQLVEA